ncbi:MAG: succinyl-diaminopimelate desuccinylase [Myxococcales bacterium]|nr:succinyl-diaminopimelate desuccinylase [Myxococcales bacterium]
MSLDTALRDTLLDLCRIESVIGNEEALCDHVEARLLKTLPRAAVTRFHHSLIVKANERPGCPKVALVGHLDTVDTVHEGPVRVEGDRIYGCGSADMKSGLAIMLEAVERLPLAELPYELTLIFYEREEGPFAENRLGPILETFQELHALDLAICLEPSDNEVQLGCLGSVHATLTFTGRTAHSARPWQGENAFYKAAPVLAELAAREPNVVDIDGHLFREVITPTLMSGGRGRNVVPDTLTINVNFRFAPGRTPEDAVRELTDLVAGRCEVTATDLSPSGRPHATHPLVLHLGQCGVVAVKTKQAWTDVARFDAIGVPGVNFGPGNSAEAHQKNESTSWRLMVEGYAMFERFLTTRAS